MAPRKRVEAIPADAKYCILPCKSWFKTEASLAKHQRNKNACRQRTLDLLAAAQAEMEAEADADMADSDHGDEGYGQQNDRASDASSNISVDPYQNWAEDREALMEPEEFDDQDFGMDDGGGMDMDGGHEHRAEPEELPLPPLPPVPEGADFLDWYPRAGEIKYVKTSLFERIRAYQDEMRMGLYYPFSCEMEMNVVIWLIESGLSNKAIDRYLQLEYVSAFARLYYPYG